MSHIARARDSVVSDITKGSGYAPGLREVEQAMRAAGIVPVVQSLRGYASVMTDEDVYVVEVVATSDGYVVRYDGKGVSIVCSKATLSDALAVVTRFLEYLEDGGVK